MKNLALFLFLILFVKQLPGQNQEKIDSLLVKFNAANEDSSKLELCNFLFRGLVNNKPDEAEKYALIELALAKKIKVIRHEALAYTNLGVLFKNRGDYEKAIGYHFEALKIKESIGDKKDIAVSYNNLGIVYKNKGEFDKAMQQLMKALHLSEETNDKKGMAMNWGNIGVVQRLIGKMDDALTSQKLSLQFSEEIKDKREILNSLANIGLIYKEENILDSAEVYILKGNAIAIEINDQSALSKGMSALGQIYIKQKKYYEGLAAFKEAFLLREKLGDKKGICAGYLNLGDAYTKLNNYDSAEYCLRLAANLAENIGAKVELEESYLRLYKLFSSKNDNLNALKNYILYSSVKDSNRSVEKFNSIQELQTKYQSKKKDDEILLLGNEKKIQFLLLKNQASVIKNQKFEEEKKTDQIKLLDQKQQIQRLELISRETEIIKQKARAQDEHNKVILLNKDKIIQSVEIANQKFIRNLISILSIIFGFLMVIVFIQRNRILKERKQREIEQERSRISSELHDDLGSGLTKISLMSQVAGSISGAKQQQTLEKITRESSDMVDKMNGIIWALNTKNDTLPNLVSFMRKKAFDMFEDSAIKLQWDSPANIPEIPISGEARRNIYMMVNEALHNALKYSDASIVTIDSVVSQHDITISIHDNGKGFVSETEGKFNSYRSQKQEPDIRGTKTGSGNGLINMKNRMHEIGGTIDISSGPGRGTEICLKYNFWHYTKV